MDRAFLTVVALAAAYLLDWIVGDPPYLPHPVRLLGKVIVLLEKAARRLFTSPGGLKFAGGAIVVIAAGSSVVITLILVAAAYRLHPVVGLVLVIYILFTSLAGRDLRDHVSTVQQNLKESNLKGARASTALLVSRDTGGLDESSLSRATLESLFENSADGLVAPLFFAALGGPAAAVFYKVVNTMDSMLGYKTKEYIHLGFFAAKVDDILSFIPARLTAIMLIIASSLRGRWHDGWRVLRDDRRKHESPNSAWPEAAAAGVLGLKFGGADYYHGELIERAVINSSGREPDCSDINRGLTLFRNTSLLAFSVLLLLSYWLRTWEALSF